MKNLTVEKTEWDGPFGKYQNVTVANIEKNGVNVEYYSDMLYRQYRCDLEAKVTAFEYPLSPMERTMSLYQLFASGNERWPAMVTGQQRRTILMYENELRTHKRGQEWFNRILSKPYDHTNICCEINVARSRAYCIMDVEQSLSNLESFLNF